MSQLTADYNSSASGSAGPRTTGRLPNWPTYLDFGKRLFDLCLALLLLSVFLLLLPALWIAVRSDGGPAFFGHLRVGKNGRPFRCWKFRTMVVDAEARLAAHLSINPEAAEEWRRDFKLKSDPRVTRLGHMLRKTSLDELPQVWNVLCGEMSFVGPRPVVEAELEYYGEASNLCFAVRPGLTGLWQVSGRNSVKYSERVRLDLEYVSKISFRKDILILLRTVWAVLGASGR